MRDPGLSEAIRAAGGVSELARQIGISQPSVSNWIRVPAERVVSVEAATGVDRAVLRPDLYSGKKMAGDIDEVDAARAQEYALLAALLTRAPDARFAVANFPVARRCLAARSRACRARRSRRANQRRTRRARIFRSVHRLGRGELLPYGSYYLTGFLHERPLARLREDLAKHRHRARRRRRRAGGSCRHPVRDHVRPCEPPAAGAAGFRSPDLRQAHGALDRAFLHRSGECCKLRISTGGWERSAASSWTSKRRPSSCRPRAGRDQKRLDEFKEGTAMKEQEKQKLGRRDFLRAMGAGAGLAVTAAAPLATEAVAAEVRCRQEEGPLPGELDRRAEPSTASTVIRSEGGCSRADQENRTSDTSQQSRSDGRQPSRRRSRSPQFPAPVRSGGRRSCHHRRIAARAPCRRPKRPAPMWPARPSARASARIARSAAPSSPKCRTACGSARSRAGIRPINRGSHCAKGAAVRELVHGDRRLRYPMKLVNGQWTAHFLGRRHQRDRRQAAWRSARSRAANSVYWLGSAKMTNEGCLSVPQAWRLLGHQQHATIRRASAIRPPSPAWPIPGATAR